MEVYVLDKIKWIKDHHSPEETTCPHCKEEISKDKMVVSIPFPPTLNNIDKRRAWHKLCFLLKIEEITPNSKDVPSSQYFDTRPRVEVSRRLDNHFPKPMLEEKRHRKKNAHLEVRDSKIQKRCCLCGSWIMAGEKVFKTPNGALGKKIKSWKFWHLNCLFKELEQIFELDDVKIEKKDKITFKVD
ncbi:hypothetical protein C9439_00100 [archaeon SCG-AAA382B04]|nr:hypothetical protein C9439_00100 [archaeon SCG-AAA382B04]